MINKLSTIRFYNLLLFIIGFVIMAVSGICNYTGVLNSIGIVVCVTSSILFTIDAIYNVFLIFKNK